MVKRPHLAAFIFFLTAAHFTSAIAAPADSTVHFEMLSHLMIVKAHINGSADAYNFVIDTGGVTFVDKRLAEELELKQQAMMAKIDRLDLSGFHIDKVFCFTTFDFQRFNALGTPLHGIIGSNLMERYKVTLDFESSSISFSSDTTSLDGAEDGLLLTFRNHQVNNAPIVDFKIGGRQLEGMIDTGQPYPIVFPLEYFEEYKGSDFRGFIKSRGLMEEWPMTTADHNYLTRLESFEFGTMMVDSVICLFGELPQLLAMPLIGNDFLSQFKIVINYPRDEMLMFPREGMRFDSNCFSIGLNPDLSRENEVVVKGVWEGSPADRAGIETGDVILSFDSREATRATLIELMDMMEDDATESITLEVGDHETVREIRLNKAMLFTP